MARVEALPNGGRSDPTADRNLGGVFVTTSTSDRLHFPIASSVFLLNHVLDVATKALRTGELSCQFWDLSLLRDTDR
jgi:hypothetical protein